MDVCKVEELRETRDKLVKPIGFRISLEQRSATQFEFTHQSENVSSIFHSFPDLSRIKDFARFFSFSLAMLGWVDYIYTMKANGSR
jgi:hypothetical protein